MVPKQEEHPLAKWWAWYGGGFWGPRFFLLLAFPAALALSVCMANVKSRNELALLLVIISLSVWVGIDGVLFGETGMEICQADSYKLELLCWYTPEFSALWRPAVQCSLPPSARQIWGRLDKIDKAPWFDGSANCLIVIRPPTGLSGAFQSSSKSLLSLHLLSFAMTSLLCMHRKKNPSDQPEGSANYSTLRWIHPSA